MGSFTKITSTGIKDGEVKTAELAGGAVAEVDLASDAITSAKIADGTVTASDLATTQDWSGKTVTLPGAATSEVDQNIALLGFKMAVNEGLTVFNLVDGVVDEFHDESGTDEGEGSNDLYCASCDFYKNQTSPVALSGGFTMSARTESDTSVAMTNPTYGAGTFVLGLHANQRNFEIAKKENSVIFYEEDYINQYEGFDPNNPESLIGLTLMQEEYLDQSIVAASYIQNSFVQNLKRKKIIEIYQKEMLTLMIS